MPLVYQAILSGIEFVKSVTSQSSPEVINDEAENLSKEDDDEEGFVTDEDTETDVDDSGSGN